jgi:hypothetical protein
MMADLLQIYIERTNRKLHFAELMLAELTERQRTGQGDDFDRAHMEAVLFHLIGTRDSFLQEVNTAYRLGLPEQRVTYESVLRKARGIDVPELGSLRALHEDDSSWLWISGTLRNIAAHRQGNPLSFYMGGPRDGRVFFKHPVTGEDLPSDAITSLSRWLDEMRTLIRQMRQSRRSL